MPIRKMGTYTKPVGRSCSQAGSGDSAPSGFILNLPSVSLFFSKDLSSGSQTVSVLKVVVG